MALTRRALLRLLAAASAAPTVSSLAACGDDAGGSPSTDAGADAGTDADAGGDAGPDAHTDAGADAEPDVLEPDDLPEYEYDGPLGPEALFAHGVASGDPLPDAVVIWTKVSPEDDAPTEVWWEIAVDPDFVRRVAVGTFVADTDRYHTVKVDVTGLEADRPYWYRFMSLGRTSVVGRTRTAPVGDVDRLRFAVVACSNLPAGYFHVYRSIAERNDLHAVVHLGDYIYEGGGGSVWESGGGEERQHDPPYRIRTLDDYRRRYANYRLDPDLQEVHRQHPFIAVWDDHETINNAWREGADAYDNDPEGYAELKANAQQAWFEWIPMRDTDDNHIWRTLRYGEMADLIMLDTRIWGRDEQAQYGQLDVMLDPERSILGDDQEAWFLDQLRTSTARWKVVGQQVMMAQFTLGQAPLNPDQWDGYHESRKRFFDALVGSDIDDVVVLTGDIHSSWASDLTPDPFDTYDPDTGAGSLAVEFVCTSVTSPATGQTEALLNTILEQNPHMQWTDLAHRGFLLLDLSAERCQGAWFHMETVFDPNDGREFFARAYSTQAGANHLVRDDEPAPPIDDAPPAAS